jgi:ribosomal protein S18 acetylase RimI-like enzyme
MVAKIRDFVDGELSSLLKLINEAYKNHYEFTPFTEDRVRSWLREGKFRILVAEENGEIVASGAYRDSQWGEEIEWLKVFRNVIRKEIEDSLVKELEKFVKGEVLFTAVDAGSPEMDVWVERGYKVEGGLLHMISVLDGVKPIPETPEGIILRSLKPTEEKAFVEAVNIGFGRERVRIGDIQLWKTEDSAFSEEWIHVAEAEGKIVSVVVSQIDRRYNLSCGGSRGYLGPAATLPEYRNKSLAGVLTRRAMNFLFEKGLGSVALYTSEQNLASMALLQKLGFRIGHHWKFLRKYFKR